MNDTDIREMMRDSTEKFEQLQAKLRSPAENAEIHDKLTAELRSAVAAVQLSENASIIQLTRILADLVIHDSKTMMAADFRSTYAGLENDIRRAVRKWAREC